MNQRLLDLDSTMEDEDPQNELVGKEVDDPKNNEIVDKAMEIDGKNEEQPPKGSDGGSKKNANSKSTAILTTNSDGQLKAQLVNVAKDSSTCSKMKTLSGGTVSPKRASKRTAATADQDSVQKAAKLKARQNLEFASDKGKNVQLSSFIFQDDTYLLNSTKSLGILLGNNDLEINNSLELLRST